MGFALLKAKSSKILKKEELVDGDETAEEICSLYVHQPGRQPLGFYLSSQRNCKWELIAQFFLDLN